MGKSFSFSKEMKDSSVFRYVRRSSRRIRKWTTQIKIRVRNNQSSSMLYKFQNLDERSAVYHKGKALDHVTGSCRSKSIRIDHLRKSSRLICKDWYLQTITIDTRSIKQLTTQKTHRRSRIAGKAIGQGEREDRNRYQRAERKAAE